MELIHPRSESSNFQLVLRTRRHLVVYNPVSREVSLHPNEAQLAGASEPMRLALIQSTALSVSAPPYSCPVCHRPWNTDYLSTHSSRAEPTWNEYDDDYVHVAPHYFRLLSQSLLPGANEPGMPFNEHTTLADGINEGYYKRFFVELQQLGRGSRGTVFLCQHVLNGHALGTYAVKKVPVGNHSGTLHHSLGEVHLMEELVHPNVIHYKHAWIEMAQLSPFAPSVPTLHVLMMAANGGSLEDWISARSGYANEGSDNPMNQTRIERLKAEFRKRRTAAQVTEQKSTQTAVHFLREDEILQLMKDVTSGLEFLHSRGILHLDLKPANVLLHWDDDALLPKALLSDFGSSLSQHQNWMRTRTGNTGTLEYMAPETIVPHEGQLAELTSKADIWSLGILLYTLIFFDLPYTQVADINILQHEISSFHSFEETLHRRGLHCRYKHINPTFVHLLKRMLQVNPHQRPSCQEILVILGQYSQTAQEQPSAQLAPYRPLAAPYPFPSQRAAPSQPTQSVCLHESTTANNRLYIFTLLLPLVIILTYAQIAMTRNVCWSQDARYNAWLRHFCTFFALAQVAYASTSQPFYIFHADIRLLIPCVTLLGLMTLSVCD